MTALDDAVKEVLTELRDLRREVGEFRRDATRDIADVRVDVATLKTKSKVWGGVLGALAGGTTYVGAWVAKLTHLFG